jgi:hypothetical protein
MISYEDISKESFELAFKLASEKLARLTPDELCRRSGARPLDQNSIMLHYLNHPYQVAISSGDMSRMDAEENIPIKDRILILHYLTQATGAPFANQLIAYSQIQGGNFYCPAFQQRTLDPILKCFGARPELLVDLAKRFGGQRAGYGDVSVSVDAFPFVRVVIVLWRGDDEVPTGGNILFDKNITDYLSTEDIVVLSETIIWKLINLAKSSSS